MKNYRQHIIFWTTFLAGLYFFLDFVLPETIGGVKFGEYNPHIYKGIQVIAVMAIGLGIINIVVVHGANIVKNKKGWGNSLALIIGMLVVFYVEGGDLFSSEARLDEQQKVRILVPYVTLLKEQYQSEPTQAIKRIEPLVKQLEELKTGFVDPDKYISQVEDEQDLNNKTLSAIDQALASSNKLLNNKTISEADFDKCIGDLKVLGGLTHEVSMAKYESKLPNKTSTFFYHAFYVPLGASMFSLLAFYIANAAYRSFRIRSLEASFMMLAAIVVMLGQIPFGPLYISESLPEIRTWILKVVNAASFRAIFFGASLAGLAMAVRMWLSLEKSPLSTGEEE